MFNVKEIKAISRRDIIDLMDPKISNFLNLCEHYNPKLHKIHDSESCLFCKNKQLVNNPNAIENEPIPRTKLVLFYDLKKGVIYEKETEFFYEPEATSLRKKLIFTLIKQRKYIPTHLLTILLESSSEGNISRTIQKINKLFTEKFNTEQKIIVGKIGKGYRLNPAIRMVNETRSS
jgi:hypothetical protein